MSRILIVDDDADMLVYCQTILTPFGHQVLMANDVDEAALILEATAVDLLVVDIGLPVKSGFELLKMVKNSTNARGLVLMLTARRTHSDVLYALELGAIDYICKPMDKEIFLNKVHSIVRPDADPIETEFAEAGVSDSAVLSLDVTLASLSEMGLVFWSAHPLDRDVRFKLKSPTLSELGLDPALARVFRSEKNSKHHDYPYRIYANFIGLDEPMMKKIRKWVSSRQIAPP